MLKFRILKNITAAHIQKTIYQISNDGFSIFSQPNISYSKLDYVRRIHSQTAHKIYPTQKLNADQIGEKLSEKEFVAQLKNDPDLFGPRDEEQEVEDLGDIAEEKFFTEQVPASQKLRTKQYADMIKKFIRKRKIKEAIDVLEVRMIKEDRVKPENYIYNLILGGCGRVGYTKKAFMLYNDMKKRGLKVTGGTYTALFNACANSPWPLTDGLTRAKHLREIMIEKQYDPNVTNYNAMIKAFGRCGDLQTAFSLVDEMITKRMPLKDDTFNFLLQACITDKEAGFRHALLIWRKMVTKRIAPSTYTYNMILRCIRDCGLGDLEATTDVIKKITNNSKNNQKQLEGNTVKQLETNNSSYNETDDIQRLADKSIQSTNSETDDIILTENETNAPILSENDTSNIRSITNLRPNLMADVPYLGNIISLTEVTKPEDRLLLVGGSVGFLENMEKHNCTPDIKTFTQLLDSIPGTLAAEKELLSIMKKKKVKPDIDFYNMLIKKRSMRGDYDDAQDVLKLIRKINYYPDLITYGVLSLGCKNKEDALNLIESMKNDGFRINAEILGAMLQQACYHFNYSYILEIMDICIREDVQPNKKFLSHLTKFYNHVKQQSNDKTLTSVQEKKYRSFKAKYKAWLTQIKIDDTEDAHPWQQFRQNTIGNEKYIKPKDTARFKQQHTSLFKVKTSPKHAK